MSWFVCAWGPSAEEVLAHATRTPIAGHGAPQVIRETGFCLAHADARVSPRLGRSELARTADAALLLVGHVNDWSRLEAREPQSRRRPQESRAAQLLRLWHPGAFGSWVDELDGAFALVVHDRRRDALYVARDPMGGVPVFWVRTAGALVLSSHLPSLLALPRVSRDLHVEEACRYLYLNQISDGSDTLVRSIHQVPADERMRFDARGPARVHRWRPKIAAPPPAEAAAVQELRRRLEDAIRAATTHSLRPAVALSGGLDSSALAGLLTRHHEVGAVSTHSVAYPQFPAERDRIATFVRATAVNSTVVTPKPEEFAGDLETLVAVAELPFTHPGVYTHFRAYESAAAAGADVVLIGEGADGSFGARAKYGCILVRDLARSDGIRRAVQEARRLVHARGWNYLLGEGVLRLLPTGLRARAWWHAWGCTVPRRWRRRLHRHAPRSRRGDLRSVLAGDLSTLFAPEMWQYRRLGTHFGLEVRYPFLDARVTEWTLGLPTRLRVRDGLLKWALRASLAGVVPDPVRLSKEKMGFTFPFRTWASGALRSLFTHALQDAGRHDYADGPRLLGRLEAYLRQPHWLHEGALWRAVNLEAWRRVVLERDHLPARWFQGAR